ncbi:hypothetical protein IPH92_04275 [Candidatus Kaiserbacteria bacterium]|nr:MAG: hypothetical protein IPH92_04275 [Candidatus Kaiserbacteria bacterium]
MIKFNEVTWYSKFAAIIFFIGVLPALAFYIGTQYQLATNIDHLQNNVTDVNPSDVKTINPIITHTASSAPTYIQKLTCHDTPHYFVITHPLEDPGEAILIKQKINENQKIDCVYTVEKEDFEIMYENFLAIESNFLITDSGTAPGIRGLQIYDLNSKKEVLNGSYSKPIEIKNGALTYWHATDEVATKSNCSKLDEYAEQGAYIENRVTLILPDMTQKDLGEKRCSLRN